MTADNREITDEHIQNLQNHLSKHEDKGSGDGRGANSSTEMVERVRAELEAAHADGEKYIKTKHIAAELETSGRALSSAMAVMNDRGVVGQYSQSNNQTVWKITL